MNNYRLGTLDASKQLITDLYLILKEKINKWSEITHQTPQARMGYIGQHLVSVVTGFKGGKSGARGHDLIIDENKFGEIKTCYRVDQLGKCKSCNHSISNLENECEKCGSTDIERKDDSKWLITIKHDGDFCSILAPHRYYLVLFESDEKIKQDINIKIWEVDPKFEGFAYCMIDYYINIRSKSNSKAPFNLWPYQLKFYLMNPVLIYQSVIKSDGNIDTKIFPTLNNSFTDNIYPLSRFNRANNLTLENIKNIFVKLNPSIKGRLEKKKKKEIINELDNYILSKNISNLELCKIISEEIYIGKIIEKKSEIPPELIELLPGLV